MLGEAGYYAAGNLQSTNEIEMRASIQIRKENREKSTVSQF